MLKRKIAAAAMATMLLLSGCGGQKPQEEVSSAAKEVSESIGKGFDAKATIKMGEIKATADINRTKEGTCTFVIAEPKSMEGMTFAFDQDTVTLSYLGLNLTLDQDSMLTSAMSKAVISAINKAAEPNGIQVTAEGKALTVTGDTDSGSFTLTLDRESRSMLTLKIPALELECNFDPFEES